MVQNNKDELDIGGNGIELLGQPLALPTGDFFERTVEDEYERIGGTDGVVSTLFQVREMLEIISQSHFPTAVKIVVAERWIHRDPPLTPQSSFGIPDLPVIRIIAVVNDVTSNGDECGIDICYGANERSSHRGVRSLCIIRISKPCVSVG